MFELIDNALYQYVNEKGVDTLLKVYENSLNLGEEVWDNLEESGVRVVTWYTDAYHTLPVAGTATMREYLEAMVREVNVTENDIKRFLLFNVTNVCLSKRGSIYNLYELVEDVNGITDTKDIMQSISLEMIVEALMEYFDDALLIKFLTSVCYYTILPVMLDPEQGVPSISVEFEQEEKYVVIGIAYLSLDTKVALVMDEDDELTLDDEDKFEEYIIEMFASELSACFTEERWTVEVWERVSSEGEEYSLTEILPMESEEEAWTEWEDAELVKDTEDAE